MKPDDKLLIPKGWGEFMGACPDTCYTDCNYNLNGKSTWFRDPHFSRGGNYGTSLIGNYSVDFAQRAMKANYPFLLVVASHAPHGPATPAPWYADLYNDSKAPRTEAFNVSSPDKHWIVATQPSLTDMYVSKKIDHFYQNRLRSLRSVDDIVENLYSAVEDAGQLDRTYFVFTSDHGLHMGQFCLGPCKRQPYETDLRVPALIVGPGIEPGPRDQVAGMVDLAPTLIELAGGPTKSRPADRRGANSDSDEPFPLDGRSLAPILFTKLNQKAPWRRDTYLIEYFATTGPAGDVSRHLKDNSNNTFIGLRILNATHNLAYFEFTDAVTDWNFRRPNFCEMYDLDSDPHQLRNICRHADSATRSELHETLFRLFRCKGGECP